MSFGDFHNVEFCYSIFPFLKRWKLEIPDNVAELSTFDSESVKELTETALFLASFDQEARYLIKAFFVMGFLMEKASKIKIRTNYY